jgi:hypothetical protein
MSEPARIESGDSVVESVAIRSAPSKFKPDRELLRQTDADLE